jgi:cysteine desulfurase
MERMSGVRQLRDLLWQRLLEAFDGQIVLNGHPEYRLPNTLHVSFLGKVGADILAKLPEVAASTGSACHDGTEDVSPVLRAMGVPPKVGAGAVRFSLGIDTTAEEIEWVVVRLTEVAGCADEGCARPAELNEFVLDYCI